MSSDLQSQLAEILGPAYRIDRELGGAGMSRVFVATELDLDRQVVVKIPPPDVSAGLSVERFRREIQLAARLQHPHIIPLLVAGARGRLLYYTMPFMAGENLRTRLGRTRELPVPEATRILRDVLDALGYAHSKAVVHRDIKPENILLSGNHALVLDFGVFKALANAADSSPGEPILTSTGIALGTPAYMAPEQALADPNVDARADLYALGVVAYEMLAGRTPFPGLSPQQTLGAQVSRKPPDITEFRPEIPPGLAAIIMRCLAKNPADRWQSADELYHALEPFTTTSGSSAPATPAPSEPFKWTPQRIAVAAGVFGIVVAGLIGSTIAFRGNREALVVSSTRQLTSAAGLEFHPAVSPDGKMVAYVAGTPGRSQLFVRQLAGGRAILLSDSSVSPRWPQWNPDGSQILYNTGLRSWLVPVLGGAPTRLPALDSLYQCSWSHTGDRFVCGREDKGGLVVLGRNGENRRMLTGPDAPDVFAPTWSRDDKLIAFTRGNGAFLGGPAIGNIAPSTIWVIPSEGGKAVRVSDDTHLNTAPVWTPDGDLLYVSSLGGVRDIYVQRLNGNHTPRGAPLRLTTGLNPHTISLSKDGKVLSYSVFTTVANVWTTTDRGGPEVSTLAAKAVTTGNQTVEQGFVSPDGKWLAYDSNVAGNQDIYRIPLPTGDPEQLTRNEYDDFHPAWSPDGTELVFHSVKNGNRDIFVMNADGTNVRPVVEGPGEQRAPSWLGDDRVLYVVFPDSLFSVKRENGVWQKPSLLFRGKATPAMYSPDGKQMVHIENAGAMCATCIAGMYVSNADGTNPRYIPLPKTGVLLQNAGGSTWTKDSKHFYAAVSEQDGTSSIWEIPVNGGVERRVLHFTDPARQLYRSDFDVFGNNFYFTIGDRQSDVWTMELKKQ